VCQSVFGCYFAAFIDGVLRLDVERSEKDSWNLSDFFVWEWEGNGYSVLLAVCSAICPASFWSYSANLYGVEHFGECIDFFYAIHFVFRENGRHFPFNN
jgi:hypothetical protein